MDVAHCELFLAACASGCTALMRWWDHGTQAAAVAAGGSGCSAALVSVQQRVFTAAQVRKALIQVCKALMYLRPGLQLHLMSKLAGPRGISLV